MRSLGPRLAPLLLLLVHVAIAHAEVRVGDPLPAVSLRDWQGRTVTLRDLRGQVAVIDFWATWCQVCRTALPALDALGRRRAAAGLVVVGINIDTSRPSAEQFLAERLPHPAMTLWRDPDGVVLARFGAQGMPAVYVIDRDGIVRLAEAGYTPERLEAVERVIERLLGP